uniref:Uncharacterized protein n=1 Tax=Isometrus maculatus TaxID=497827 RepID=A0A0U1SPE7_ISOMC|nr:hypothetical protein [Isometrus maculatus]
MVPKFIFCIAVLLFSSVIFASVEGNCSSETMWHCLRTMLSKCKRPSKPECKVINGDEKCQCSS